MVMIIEFKFCLLFWRLIFACHLIKEAGWPMVWKKLVWTNENRLGSLSWYRALESSQVSSLGTSSIQWQASRFSMLTFTRTFLWNRVDTSVLGLRDAYPSLMMTEYVLCQLVLQLRQRHQIYLPSLLSSKVCYSKYIIVHYNIDTLIVTKSQ